MLRLCANPPTEANMHVFCEIVNTSCTTRPFLPRACWFISLILTSLLFSHRTRPAEKGDACRAPSFHSTSPPMTSSLSLAVVVVVIVGVHILDQSHFTRCFFFFFDVCSLSCFVAGVFDSSRFLWDIHNSFIHGAASPHTLT